MKSSKTILYVLLFLISLSLVTVSQTLKKDKANSPSDTMPVELVYFYPEVEGAIVNLYWGTATEVNNYGYDVERAEQTSSFIVIGFLPGHGNSFSPKYYSFSDSTIISNGIYRFRLKQIDTDGVSEYSDTVEVVISTVDVKDITLNEKTFSLFQNYPNPFNPTTNISFELPSASHVQLKIFDVLGNEILALLNDELNSGSYNYMVSLEDLSRGKTFVSSGTYFYSIIIDNGKNKFIETKKMTIIK